MRDDKKYSYLDAGFNRFFHRKISGGSEFKTLSSMNGSQVSSLNFDQLQVSGSLGNTLQVGNIFVDGINGRIDIQDAVTGQVMGRFGQEG